MDFTKKELMENVWQISDIAGNCCTLVVGSRKALLFDTMIGLGELKPYLQAITRLPLIVVNSHGHLDHTGGNGQFERVYINFLDLAYWRINERNISAVENTLQKDLDNCRFSFRYPPAFMDLKEDMVFDLGGCRARAIALPGHSPGSMGLFLPEKRLVLVGDACSPQMCLFMEETQSLWVYQETLMKLQQLDFDYFVVGHYMRLFPKRLLSKCLAATELVGRKKGMLYSYSMIPSYQARFFLYESGNPDVDDGIICILVDPKLAQGLRTYNKMIAY